ncbi:MAG: hypothetical protein IPK82_25095 [Polyangiaceae bacterium]|nr:hypothetical protein [Polyangiaceae bacterium]
MRSPRFARIVLPILVALWVPTLGACSLFDRKGDSGEATPPPKVTPPAAPTTAVYTVNRASDGNPNLFIQKVTVTPQSTTVEMSYANKTTGAVDIMLAPTHDPEVMFLESQGKRIHLKSAEGISFMPNRTKVAQGETKVFTAVFEPLPPGATSFDLYEGEQGKMAKIGSGSLWVFRNVQLK